MEEENVLLFTTIFWKRNCKYGMMIFQYPIFCCETIYIAKLKKKKSVCRNEK